MATPADAALFSFSATAETMICFSQPGEFARAECGWPRQMAPEASKPVARTRLRMNKARSMAAGIVPDTLDRMAIPHDRSSLQLEDVVSPSPGMNGSYSYGAGLENATAIQA